MKPQDLEEAVQSWLSLWQDCRCLAPTPPAAGASNQEASRLFVLRVSSLVEAEVPISANGALQKQALARLARAAEEETPEALSLYVRLSFIYTPLGGRPEVYGHSFTGPRLQIQRVQSRVSGSEGHLVVHATAAPPALFFFRSAIASKDLRILAEILAFEEPPRQATASTPAVNRIWKLAAPKAKAKPKAKPKAKAKAAALEPPLELQKAYKTRSAAPGGRASSSWPLMGGRYPLPLFDDAEPECVVGWAMISFDLATESRSIPSSHGPKRLRHGPLRERLLTAAGGKVTHAMDQEIHRLLTPPVVKANATKPQALMESDLQVVPLDDAAKRLLPLDFPAVTEALRMGGLEVIEDASGLQIDADLNPNVVDPDIFVRGLLVTLPDNVWMDNFLRALPSTSPTAPGMPAPPSSWELVELHALVGSHNTLRWLDEPLRGLSEAMAAHYPLDDTGHTWRLKLEKLEDGQRFWFGGEVPVEFVCHPDCAVVVELVAVLRTSGAMTQTLQNQAVTAPLLGAQMTQAGDIFRKVTLGWTLLLPFYHTTSEGLLKASTAAPGERQSLAFDLELYSGPGLSLLGEEVWMPSTPSITAKPEELKPVRPAVTASQLRTNFNLCGDRVVQWLRQHIPLPTPETPLPAVQPMTLSTLQPLQPGLPQPLQPSVMVPDASVAPVQPFGPVQPHLGGPVPSVHQPVIAGPNQKSPVPAQQAAPVVEKIYLRDQAVQSDPPPLGFDDNIIKDAAPKTQGTSTTPPARPLGALDRAHLLSAGGPVAKPTVLSPATTPPVAPSVAPGESAPVRRELRWKFEDEDLLQADEITLELVALRSFAELEGERIYFQLRFFVFPPVKTTTAALAGKPGEACLLRSAVTNERLAVVYSMDGYSINSVSRSAAAIHRSLVEYLSARNVDIEIWSADSEMQIGVASVPLEMLVRQGHQVAKIEGEHAVLEPLTGEPRGTLRVLLVNRGQPATAYKELVAPPAPPPPPDDGNPQSPPAAPSPSRRTRHKVSALMEPGQNAVGGAQNLAAQGSMAEELNQKKHERLKQLRVLRQDASDGVSEHTAFLAAAESLRQDRKRQEVARRMDRFNTTQQSLTSSFATPSYFTVNFTNPYGQQATFNVHILARGEKPQPPPEIVPSVPPQAPLQGVLVAPPEQNLMLIKDPEEWRRLTAQGLLPTAPSGDYGRLAAGSFILNPRESISLPFRYLDFDFPGLDATPQQASAMRLAEVAASVAPSSRDFLVEVALHQGPVLRRVEVSVVPQPSVVDRKIRYFEAEGAAVEKVMALPPVPQTSSSRSCYVYCTSKSVHLQRRDEEEVSLRFMAPQSPSLLSFFVVFYGDAHFSNLVAIQLVEVQGLRTERIRLVVGQGIERSICLAPAEVLDAGTVRLHSSNPEAVQVQPTAEVDPRYGVKFNVLITSMQVGTKSCRLHAVDPAVRRLVAAMLIVIAADPPEIKMVHNISLPVLTSVRKRLLYKNEAVRPLKYSVRCSEPALVSVQSPELVINSLDTRTIELLFHAVPATLSYSAEVFLFITSDDRVISETRLLQLSYT